MLIEWSDELSVGHEAIDRDHRRLIEIINTLEAAIAAGDGERAVGETLAELAEYARGHFDREERLMLRHRYRGYDVHKWAHDGFLDELARMIPRLESGEAAIDRATLDLLRNWMVTHVSGLDRELGTFLKW